MAANGGVATDRFESTRRLYDAGDYAGVLELHATPSGRPDPRLLALLANANLKLGRNEAAADAFVTLAGLVEDKRAFILKSAALLYMKSDATEKLAGIAVMAIRANAADSALALELLRRVGPMLEPEELEGQLAHLDRHNGEHVYFISNVYRERLKDFERAYSEILQGIAACPNDAFLRIQRFSMARVACDFPILREFADLIGPPRGPFGQQVFENQIALDRLYWLDDEAEQAQPTRVFRQLDSLRAAHLGGRRARRPISAASERLRIGYISNDFGNDVVSQVFRPVMERHDPEKFDIRLFCYSGAEARKFQEQHWPSELRAKVEPIDTMTDAEAAAAISAAGIDILVDLKGHTKTARLGIMGITDAPLTATYLGYPGSVFGAGIDYLISDPIVTPDSSRPYYAEKLCRLPEVQMPNNRLDAIPPIASRRSDWGLPEDAFVFASFNGQQKITIRTMNLWARILHAAPDAILWMACGEEIARTNLLAEFERLGIGRARIVFNTKVGRRGEHIGRLGLADLALDTLPYNGHSTTADMLRGGLPLLTTKGNSYHSRVSWSILKSCDLEDLAAEDDEHYYHLAATFAQKPEMLDPIREKLLRNRGTAPVFDPDRMTRHLELAYGMMAERVRAGLPLEHIDVPGLKI